MLDGYIQPAREVQRNQFQSDKIKIIKNKGEIKNEYSF